MPLKYERGHLEVLNQLLLPHQQEWDVITSIEDGWQAIRQMKVHSYLFTSVHGISLNRMTTMKFKVRDIK